MDCSMAGMWEKELEWQWDRGKGEPGLEDQVIYDSSILRKGLVSLIHPSPRKLAAIEGERQNEKSVLLLPSS